MTTRKQYYPKFRARLAIEAIRGEGTLNPLATQSQVHPVRIAHWRRSALEHLEEIPLDGRRHKPQNADDETNALYEELGRVKVEVDCLKKRQACRSIEQHRQLADWKDGEFSVRRQRELLRVSRASRYY